MTTKRTYQPKIRRRQRVHGFRKRMKSSGGRNVIKARRKKGRHQLAVKPGRAKRADWNGTKGKQRKKK